MRSARRKSLRSRKRDDRSSAERTKVRKRFWLDPGGLTKAQGLLGTATENETVEAALDLVVFPRRLADGARGPGGLTLKRL